MADFDMNPEGEMRDPRQILHDMKTEARRGGAAEPQPLMKNEVTPRIGAPGTGFDLASGVYEGAGGYEYEVMPGGAIKILKAPNDRGVGVTLKLGHPAHEAIFDELSESGASPMTEPSKSPSMVSLSDDAQEAFDRVKSRNEKKDTVALGDDAQAAFDRVKKRNEERS